VGWCADSVCQRHGDLQRLRSEPQGAGVHEPDREDLRQGPDDPHLGYPRESGQGRRRQMELTMKLTALALRQMKSAAAIPMLTAYTTPVARSLERAGIPVILVGDTVGMVEMGFDSTRHTTLEHMKYHVGAVRRGAPQTHIIGDLPYNTYTT